MASPPYEAGMEVLYKNAASGAVEPALIAEVHLDDVEPYYSILLVNDGREKQTDDSRIVAARGADERCAGEEGGVGTERAEAEAGEVAEAGADGPTENLVCDLKAEKNDSVKAIDRTPYKSGMEVFYRNISHGTVEPARIAEVHLDDAEPYYSILLACGREKQTDDSRIMLSLDHEKETEGISLGNEKASEEASERDAMANGQGDSERGLTVWCDSLANCFR